MKLSQIFSVKNNEEYKVISIFNLKIKFKTKLNLLRVEYKNLKKNNNDLREKNKNIKKEKNRLENALKENAELYEKHILNYRKQELDEIRQPIIDTEIEQLLSSKEFPMFSMIEIETINRCVGECAFCPVNRHDDPREFKLMDEALFHKIIQELKKLNYGGRVCLFSNNEPLMDKRIFSFAEFAKKALPNNHFSFFTNGILLDLEKFKRVVSYCDTFCIDIYYDKNEIIPENIKPIIEECKKNSDLQKKVIVNFTDKNAIRNNRGGNSKNRSSIYKLKSSCLLPFKQVIVRPDGKLSLCCNDALGEYTMGDLSKENLINIWRGSYYKQIRELLKQGRDKIRICEYCDNFGGFGTNKSSNEVYTDKQFKTSWKKVEKLLNEQN